MSEPEPASDERLCGNCDEEIYFVDNGWFHVATESKICRGVSAVPAAPSLSTDHTDEREALVRRAIADPGRFTSRLSYDESVPAWGARAVLIALDRFEAGRGYTGPVQAKETQP